MGLQGVHSLTDGFSSSVAVRSWVQFGVSGEAKKGETTAAKESPLSEQTAMEVRVPGRSGGRSLRGACLSDSICFLEKVTMERLQS